MMKRKNGMPRSLPVAKTTHRHEQWQIRESDADGTKYCAACGADIEEKSA